MAAPPECVIWPINGTQPPRCPKCKAPVDPSQADAVITIRNNPRCLGRAIIPEAEFKCEPFGWNISIGDLNSAVPACAPTFTKGNSEVLTVYYHDTCFQHRLGDLSARISDSFSEFIQSAATHSPKCGVMFSSSLFNLWKVAVDCGLHPVARLTPLTTLQSTNGMSYETCQQTTVLHHPSVNPDRTNLILPAGAVWQTDDSGKPSLVFDTIVKASPYKHHCVYGVKFSVTLDSVNESHTRQTLLNNSPLHEISRIPAAAAVVWCRNDQPESNTFTFRLFVLYDATKAYRDTIHDAAQKLIAPLVLLFRNNQGFRITEEPKTSDIPLLRRAGNLICFNAAMYEDEPVVVLSSSTDTSRTYLKTRRHPDCWRPMISYCTKQIVSADRRDLPEIIPPDHVACTTVNSCFAKL